MVDRADPGFFGAAWRFGDFCQQLNAGSVYLQSVLNTKARLAISREPGQVSRRATTLGVYGI